MRIAFVGVKRKYLEIPEDYRWDFTQYHLELPYYYARDGRNDVVVTTVDWISSAETWSWFDDMRPGLIWHEKESDFRELVKGGRTFDVVVHWRKWHDDLYVPGAVNVINCQDHSFGPEWQAEASRAFANGKLYGILCFPEWHKANLLHECQWLPPERAYAGVTLGVDTEAYFPAIGKDPRRMLWASDPGRGIEGALRLAVGLWQKDRRYRLHICYPDYAKPVVFNHPAVVVHGCVPNGPKLQALFNETGILPYTSNFKEPSSRAHRQAQAAGCLVFYPPGMGTPSDLLSENYAGVVSPPETWEKTILEIVDKQSSRDVMAAARELALSENWAVQAQRFNALFEGILAARRA